MTSSGDSPIQVAVTQLAAEGQWSAIVSGLATLEEGELLASSNLAYRYGEALYHTGQMVDLRTFADRFVATAREASDTMGILRALNLAGIAAFELGEIDAAERAWDELLGLADGVGDHDMIARASNNLGAVANLRGRPNQAVVLYRLAIPVYQRLDQLRGLAQTHHNVGVSLRDLGRWEDAISSFQQATDVASRIPYPPVVVMTMISRAELETRRSDHDVATELASRAVDLARELGDPISEGAALRVRGTAQATNGDLAPGVADLEAALSLARTTDNRLLEAETLRDLGEAESDPQEARAHRERALAMFESLGATSESARLRELLED